MPPPEEGDRAESPEQKINPNLELKLESTVLSDLQENQCDESIEENIHFSKQGNDDCSYNSHQLEMNHFVGEGQFTLKSEKNSNSMDTIIEGNGEVNFESMNSGFEAAESMETEVSEQSSHQETFFPLPCEKREPNENSMLSDANMITESEDGFESYANEILHSHEVVESKENEYVNESDDKSFHYKQSEDDDDDDEDEDDDDDEEGGEALVQDEEYFADDQPSGSEKFTEEQVFIETGFQNVEDYGSSEQVIETTVSEVPPEFISETVDSVQSIVSEETVAEDDKSYQLKTISSKDGMLQSNMKKVLSDLRSVQSPLKRPLLPGPGQSKNVFTKVIIQGNPNSSGSTGQPFKIIGSAGSSIVSGQTRSISLAQAQQMGLISPGAKIQPILPSGSSGGSSSGQKRMFVKKIVPTCSSSLLSPSTLTKSPTKILPAPAIKGNNIRPSVTTIRGPVSVANIQTIRGSMPVATIKSLPSLSNSSRPVPVAAITALRQSGLSNVNLKPVGTVKNLPGAQKVIIRQGQIPIKSGAIISPNSTGQVIRIPANASTFQPIQIGGGKQVQYVRFVSGSGNTIPTTVVNNSKSKIVKAPHAFKAIPIAPNPNPPTVKTVLPKPAAVGNTTPTAKRILIPVSQGMPQLCITNDGSSTDETSTEKSQTITTVPVTLQQLKNTGSITAIPASAVAHLRQGRNVTTLTNSQIAQLKNSSSSTIQLKTGDSGIIPMSAVNQASSDGQYVMPEGSIVMLPPEIVQQIQNTGEINNGEAPIEPNEVKSKPTSENEAMDEETYDKENIDSDGCRSTSPGRILEANGIRLKKPCNCTRSQCLKLYCECFANGEFCFQCNCNNCFNNIEHEEERQKSIKSCLERNPSAFRPKIQIGETEEDERRHNKGCHCKRSGCLKNYCECYEAKIVCSKSCKCIGCRNTEEFLEGSRSGLIDLADAAEESYNSEQKSEFVLRPQSSNSSLKQPYNFMSSEVVEATCQCLLAQAEEAERNGLSTEEGERLIIEEFGRCLVQIIGCSNSDENTSR